MPIVEAAPFFVSIETSAPTQTGPAAWKIIVAGAGSEVTAKQSEWWEVLA